MITTIQRVIAQEANLVIPASSLVSHANLYNLGLTAFDAVRLLVAIEREFKVEFPREILTRDSVVSIEKIAMVVTALQQPPGCEAMRKAA